MELKENKLKTLNEMPLIESKVFKSKDGSYIVHKTTITDIKSIKYYDKVMASESEEPAVI